MPRRRGPIGRVRNRRNVDRGGTPAPYPVTLLCTVASFTDNGSDTYITLASAEWNGTTWTTSSLMNWKTEAANGFVLNGSDAPLQIEDEIGNPSVKVLRFAGVFGTGTTLILPPWANSIRGPNGEWLAGMATVLP